MFQGRGRAMPLQRSLSEPVAPGVQLSKNLDSQLLRKRLKNRAINKPLGSPRAPKSLFIGNRLAPSYQGDDCRDVQTASVSPNHPSKLKECSSPVHLLHRTEGESVVISVASDGVLRHHILSHIESCFQRTSPTTVPPLITDGTSKPARHVALTIGDEKVLITASNISALHVEICNFLKDTNEELVQAWRSKSESSEAHGTSRTMLPQQTSLPRKPNVNIELPPCDTVDVSRSTVDVPRSTASAKMVEDWGEEVAGEERPAFQFGQGQFKHLSVAVNTFSGNSALDWNRLSASKSKKEMKAEMFSKQPRKPRPVSSPELSRIAHNKDIRLFTDSAELSQNSESEQQNLSQPARGGAKEDSGKQWNNTADALTSGELDVHKSSISTCQALYSRQDLLTLSLAVASRVYPKNLFVQSDNFLLQYNLIAVAPQSQEGPQPTRKFFDPKNVKIPNLECAILATPTSPGVTNRRGFSFSEEEKATCGVAVRTNSA